MSGGPDPLYVRARAALLDAAEALAEQLDAVVLVGAQGSAASPTPRPEQPPVKMPLSTLVVQGPTSTASAPAT